MRRTGLLEPKASQVSERSSETMPRIGLPLMSTILRQRGHDVDEHAERTLPPNTSEASIDSRIVSQRKYDDVTSKLSHLKEVRTSVLIAALPGIMDVAQARMLLRYARRHARREKRILILTFETVSDITPRATAYLDANLRKLESKFAEIRLQGLPDSFCRRVESSLLYIPCYEFYEAMDALPGGYCA